MDESGPAGFCELAGDGAEPSATKEGTGGAGSWTGGGGGATHCYLGGALHDGDCLGEIQYGFSFGKVDKEAGFRRGGSRIQQ